MWTIDKEFNFEAGHRVWSQELKYKSLSLETECACKHLHGHSYSLKVFLSANELDNSEMVTDFKNLNFMKEFLDNTLDHKFIIDVNDPNFKLITGCNPEMLLDAFGDFTNLSEVAPCQDANVMLHRKSFVLVGWVPTSENICKHLFLYVKKRIGDLAKVTAVELWETKKSHCRYEE